MVVAEAAMEEEEETMAEVAMEVVEATAEEDMVAAVMAEEAATMGAAAAILEEGRGREFSFPWQRIPLCTVLSEYLSSSQYLSRHSKTKSQLPKVSSFVG